MVKIIGYYVTFKGRPESRRPTLKLSVENGVRALTAWHNGESVIFINGSGYSSSGIDAIEKIKGTTELDVREAVNRGHTVVTERELEEMISSSINESNTLPSGGTREPIKLPPPNPPKLSAY